MSNDHEDTGNPEPSTVGEGWDSVDELLESSKDARDAETATDLMEEHGVYDDHQEFLDYLEEWVVDFEDIRERLQLDHGYDLESQSWTEEDESYNIDVGEVVEQVVMIYDEVDREHYDDHDAWIEARSRGYEGEDL